MAGESLRAIAQSYGITHQALSLRRRAWGAPIRIKSRTPGNYFISRLGYKMVRVEDPHKVNPYVAEHVLVAERMLGRSLRRNEVVHHLNGNKADNRPDNLLVCNRSEHRRLHRQLETLAMEMVRAGSIVYVKEEGYQWGNLRSEASSAE